MTERVFDDHASHTCREDQGHHHKQQPQKPSDVSCGSHVCARNTTQLKQRVKSQTWIVCVYKYLHSTSFFLCLPTQLLHWVHSCVHIFILFLYVCVRGYILTLLALNFSFIYIWVNSITLCLIFLIFLIFLHSYIINISLHFLRAKIGLKWKKFLKFYFVNHALGKYFYGTEMKVRTKKPQKRYTQ